MLTNQLKAALRNMLRYKGYTLINIAGLSVGVAVCLLIFLWVKDELSYDRFHANADRTYRALWEARFGDNEWKIALVPVPLRTALKSEFPEVDEVTRFYSGGYTLKKGEEVVREQHFLFVDEHFFDVFSADWIAGDPKTALAAPDGIVLTENTAQRYFGDETPMGKTILRNDGKPFQVTGVVRDYPAQSHLHFDFLASLRLISVIEQRKEQWGSAACYTYFTIRPDANAGALQEKLSAYVDKNVAGEEFHQGNNYTSFPFQALTDIHLKSNVDEELAPNGNLAYVYIFGIVALIILVLACINFVNLTTARSMTRSREVGIRKVLGSQRRQLIGQFFGEAFVYVLLATVLAVALTAAVLPAFNQFSGKALSLGFLNSPFVLLLLTGLLAVTTLLSGAFPAYLLSGFSPLSVIKGRPGGRENGNWLRQTLVVAQFCISTGLIIGTLIVHNQLSYLQSFNLGFDKEQVLVLNQATALGNNYGPFMEQLEKLPVIERVSTAQFMPGDGFDSTIFLPEQPANYKETSLNYSFIDPGFSETLKLELTEGRNFTSGMSTDSSACLINETAARKLGWEEPLGKQISYGGQSPYTVIGVVKDFNFRSLHEEIEPIVLMMSPWKLSNMAVRVRAGETATAVAAIQSLWKEMAPNGAFEYQFLDQQYDAQYRAEQRMGQVFTVFSGLAVFIACLGLFGLAAFMAEQRRKEVGIRKVLGASVAGIVSLLSRDFLRLVLLGLLLAAPAAWYLMNNWLKDFAYHTPMDLGSIWWIFAVTGLAAVLIAGATVSFQSIRAAVANPVDSLREE
ncbi:MAG TPA: ABC transporter permease [Flavilitoribacter sp.]|nr:ABC transporter permease [Flavilitoribacter sp.]